MPVVSKPGIYRGIDVAEYHADCCPVPSLSQSIAKIIIERSPLHAKIAHPKLTPVDPEDDEQEKYIKAQAIGDAAHALMIGRGKTLAVAPFDNWKTKKAQEFRDEALAKGQTPIIEKHFNTSHEILRAATVQLEQHDESDCFKNGSGEVALMWEEDGIWFRCLVDWLHNDMRAVDDFKTVSQSASEHVIGAYAANMMWDVQCAMFERGLDVLDPANAGKRRYRFIAQEQDRPYALNVVELDEVWLTIGRKKLQYAVDMWTHCLRSGKWPCYPAVAITPQYPGWREQSWLAREIEAAEKPMLTSIAGG